MLSGGLQYALRSSGPSLVSPRQNQSVHARASMVDEWPARANCMGTMLPPRRRLPRLVAGTSGV
jgi:hypothetical protein